MHKIQSTQTTAHIIAHHRKIKTSQVFKHLTDWVPKHLDWIKAVGSRILQAKKIHVEDYANDITSGLVPFDELAILVVARMYHIHIGVVLRDRVWYTSSAEKPDEIAFHLLFHGGVQYLDSCTGNWGYASPNHAVTLDITASPQAQPISLVTVQKGNQSATDNPVPTTPLNLSRPENTIDQKLDELNRELDQKLENLNKQLDLKTDKENRKRNLDQSIDSTDSSTSSRKRRRRSSSRVLRSKGTSLNNKKKPKKRSSRTSRRAAGNKLDIDLDSLLSKNCRCGAKPKNLKEQDPILDAFKDVQNEEDLKMLLEPSDDENNKKSIAVEETIDTNDGAMVVKSYGLKRNNKADRNFKCQEVNCSEVKKTQGELNKHLQFDHKISFKCFVCDRMYDTANGRSKHYKKHFKFNNHCSECSYSCQFPAQMNVHKRKHTTDTTGKFPCPTRGCSKVLLSKATLDTHRKIHDETRHACDKCPKDFGTILHLNQHLQGKHGNGAITLCGIKYQWPDSKYRHQVDCDECKELKKKQQEKPEYPYKIIIRTRKPKKLVKVQTSQLRCICCDQLIFLKQQIVSCKYVFDFF